MVQASTRNNSRNSPVVCTRIPTRQRQLRRSNSHFWQLRLHRKKMNTMTIHRKYLKNHQKNLMLRMTLNKRM